MLISQNEHNINLQIPVYLFMEVHYGYMNDERIAGIFHVIVLLQCHLLNRLSIQHI